MLFDEVLELVGGVGVYQAFLMFYYVASTMISLEGGIMNFAGGTMEHWCKIPALANFSHDEQKFIAIPHKDGKDDEFERCKRFPLNFNNFTMDDYMSWNRTERTGHFNKEDWIECDGGWVYDQSTWVSSLSAEWNLVCDDNWKVALTNTLYMGGWLVGALTIGRISDKFGRRPTVIACQILRSVFVLFCLYSVNYEMFCIGRFCLGMFVAQVTLIIFIIVQEITSVKWRVFFGVMGFLLGSAFQAVAGGIAYAVRDYFYLMGIYAWPMLIMIPFMFLGIDESPRWLVRVGRDKEAIKVLDRILKVNKGRHAELPKDLHFKEAHEEDESKTKEKGSYLDLFRTPNLRMKMMIVGLAWFTVSLVTYGLSLNAGRLPGSVFTNFILLASIDIPARLIAILVFEKFGRRFGNGFFIGFAGILMFTGIPFLQYKNLEMVATYLSVVGKGFVGAGFVGMYSFTAELSPTIIRNMAVSYGSACARVGGMVAPYVGGPLQDVWVGLPPCFFGFFGVLTGLTIFFLPETKGHKLPETVEEAEEFGKKRKKSPSDLDDGSNQISNQSAVENSYVNPVIGESEEDADTLSTYM